MRRSGSKTKHKTVTLVAYDFNCLPGHVRIEGRGTGSSLRIAAVRAMDAIFSDERVKRRQVGDFRINGVAIDTPPPDQT